MHKKAFELYNSLGSERSLEKVAHFLGKSKRSVESWSTEFKWQERLDKLEKEQKEKYRAQYEKLAELQLKIKTSCAEKFLEYIESKSKISDFKEYLGIVGSEIDLNFLGLNTSPEGLNPQSACATEVTADTPETKKVIAQIEYSLQVLDGDKHD